MGSESPALATSSKWDKYSEIEEINETSKCFSLIVEYRIWKLYRFSKLSSLQHNKEQIQAKWIVNTIIYNISPSYSQI